MPASPAIPQPTTRNRNPYLLDLLAALVDKSLVQLSPADGQEPRYLMLETVREFALERLAESGELELIATRHAEWCVRLAEGVRRSGRLSHRAGLARLEAEHPNLRAALGWLLEQGQATAALHLGGELAEFWLRHSHWSEGEEWLERALTADAGEPTAARAEALVGLNMLQWTPWNLGRAAAFLEEAEAVARAAGDAGALAYTRLHQGYVALYRDELDLAVARAEEALTTCSAIPQAFSCHGALWLLARATLGRGDDARATELYERLLSSAQVGGDEISVANAHWGLAFLAERRGELAHALAGFAEAANICNGFGDRLFASGCLASAAATAVALGRLEPAVRLYAAAKILRLAIRAAPDPNPHDHEAALATARAVLGEERFNAAWAAGAALSFDEAVAEAITLAEDVAASGAGHPAERAAAAAPVASGQIVPFPRHAKAQYGNA